MITTTKLPPDSFADVPNELILRVFSYLNLRGLIAARGVSCKWRTLVPFTLMAPARRDMLDFYNYLLTSPVFFKTRPWILANLKPFDRQAYIDKLTQQYHSLPEEFRLWVLEWPERAVVACSWPGLPRRRYTAQYVDNINITEGTNWIAYPRVSVLIYEEIVNRKAEHIPGILVRRSSKSATWLILDEREHMSGKVFHGRMGDSTLEGYLESDQLRYSFDSLEKGWIAYQRRIWMDIEDEADNCTKTGMAIRDWKDIPVDKSANAFPEAIWLGATAWLRRNEPDTQERLRWTNNALLAQSI